VRVSFEHPANTGVLRHLRRGWNESRIAASEAPERVADPYQGLGSHPDVVQRVWDELTVRLPERCRWVVYGCPALVHPRAGTVFAFTAGSLAYALRVPAPERAAALRQGAGRVHTYGDGSTLDLGEIGEDWILGGWRREEPDWCLAAYAHLATA